MKEDYTAEAIHENLGTGLIGKRIIYCPSLESTMDAARREVNNGASEGTVIVAGEQTGARGRLRRVWATPPGNIALSVILYPVLASLPYIMMLASLAVVRAIEAVAGLEARVKWPNDILVDRKKVCGILIESRVAEKKVGYVIIGIGINVGLRAADFPEIADTATSLNDETGKAVSRRDMVRHILCEMERLYLPLPEGGPVYEEWKGKLATLGRRVKVTGSRGTTEGVAEAVDGSGALLIRKDDGGILKVVAGDVSLREA